MSHTISPSPRLRRSAFYNSTVRDGVTSFAPYNHMLMPTGYGDPEAEYKRLTEGVAMWDVSVERQVELSGPDAGKLAQALVPRKLGDMPVGQGWYVAICDHRGTLINDPILLKLSEDRYWFSIADSDLLLWARAVAGERGYQVNVFEPDVSPLAVQGPLAEDVIADMLGDWVREIKHFEVREVEDDIPMVIARSGWSKQGGFEIYLMDYYRGDELWDRVRAAGEKYGIGPGNPNPSERVESSLLSYGGDTDDETNPFEVRMTRFIDVDAPDDVIGIQALRRIKEEGPRRWQLGIKLELDDRLPPLDKWSELRHGDMFAGHITAHAWSPKLEQNIGLCLVSREVKPGNVVDVTLPTGEYCRGEMCKLPFV